MAQLTIEAPVGGVYRFLGFQKQAPFTSIESINMWPKDVISGRRVSATRPPLSNFASPGPNVNLLAPISGDATQTPQFTMIAATEGDLYWYNGTDWTLVASSESVTTGRQVFAGPYLKRAFIMNDTTPLVFNYDDLSLVPWVATTGTVPPDCRICVPWAGGVWVTGALEQPHVISGSRTGDPFDWDFSAPEEDTGGAFQFAAENEGLIGQPITALVPFTSDTMLIASVDGLWAALGHPRRGGTVEQISDQMGIMGQGAWTIGPDGTLFFMSRLGVATLSPNPGATPALVSHKVVPRELIGLPFDYEFPSINLEYNVRWNGVEVNVNGDAAQSWWLDLDEEGGMHQHVFSEYPITTSRFDNIETEAASGVLHGNADGIYRFDTQGSEDMAYKLLIGPINISRSLFKKYVVNRATCMLHAETTEDSSSYITIHAGANGDDVYDRYVNEINTLDSTLPIDVLLNNYGRWFPQIGGVTILVELAGSGSGSRIVFEAMELDLQEVGESYGLTIGRTVFDPLSSNIVIGPGWDGGVAATGTAAAAPSANLADFVLFVDLSELPAEWWDAVQPDGRDIRVTTSNNALRPFDLISFDKDAQTGFLTTRFSLNSGVGYSIKVWAGNPTASAPGKASLFGSYNVYSEEYIGFWPHGAGNDRTRNHRDFVSYDSLDVGGVSGPGSYLPATHYPYGGPDLVLPYTFSTTTTDSDPGPGVIRLNNATQSSATVWRVDLEDADGVDRTAAFSALTGRLSLTKADDITKHILASFSSLASPSGYRNITLTVLDASETNPFSDSDEVLLTIRVPSETFSYLSPRSFYTFGSPIDLTDYTLIVNESIQSRASADGTGNGFSVMLSSVAEQDDILETPLILDLSGAGSLSFNLVAHNAVVMSDPLTFPDDLEDFFNYAIVASSDTGYILYRNGVSVDTDAAVAVESSLDEISVAASFENPEQSGDHYLSVIQLFDVEKSSTFIAYNNSMIDQTTFWSGWTV